MNKEKMMSENEFAALLGITSTNDDELTLERAISAIESALLRLMPSQRNSFFSDICGTTVVQWNRFAIILKGSEGQIYRVSIDEDGKLAIDQNCREAFNLLLVEGALDKVFSSDAVAELNRLQFELDDRGWR